MHRFAGAKMHQGCWQKAPELGAFSPSPMAVGDLDKNGELLGLAHATAESISVSHNRPTLDIVYLTR